MQVFELRHAYHPDLQGIEQPRRIKECDTLDEAIAEIADLDNEVYVTEHNESGRPTYAVVEDVDGDYISGGRFEDMSNYHWEGAPCECGECNECIRWMIDSDREYLVTNAVYKS